MHADTIQENNLTADDSIPAVYCGSTAATDLNFMPDTEVIAGM